MSKYQFRLETLQKVRKLHRDQQRARLTEAYQASDILGERFAELNGLQGELRKQQRAATEGTYIDVNRMAEAARYEPVLKAQEQVFGEQQTMLDQEIERRRETLLEADRNVRALELLDERWQEEHRAEESRAEVKELDEVANTRSWLQRK